MDRRRFILLGAAAAATPALAYAQTTTTPAECAIGFVNGLLQYGADCPLLTPTGTGLAIAPPSHLAPAAVDEAAATTAAQTAETETQEQLTERRNRKDEKKNRRRDHKRDKRTRSTDRKQRKRDGRRTRDERKRDAEEAVIDSCGDFATEAEALEYFMESEYDHEADPLNLDPDGDDVPCEGMTQEGI